MKFTKMLMHFPNTNCKILECNRHLCTKKIYQKINTFNSTISYAYYPLINDVIYDINGSLHVGEFYF